MLKYSKNTMEPTISLRYPFKKYFMYSLSTLIDFDLFIMYMDKNTNKYMIAFTLLFTL